MESRISLSNLPNQVYTVTIPGEKRNITFIITQSFNEEAGYWVMGIYDKSNNPVVINIPLLPGYDLLEQYGYLDIGELYIVNIGDQSVEVPDDKNIGSNFELSWVLQ